MIPHKIASRGRKTGGNQVPDIFSNKRLTQVTFEYEVGLSLFFYYLFLFKFSRFWLKILIGFEQTDDQKTPPNKLGFILHQSNKREINTGGLVIQNFGQ